MNVLRENPFLAGVILVVVAGCGVLGFFLSGVMASHEESSLAYQQAVQRLHALQNRVPFPDESNVTKAGELRDQFAAELEGLRSKLAQFQRPTDSSITPQQFQDTLRSTVNALTTKAETAKVPLPDNFYLGFDQYRASPPLEKAAPELARQLEFISDIVGDLIGSNPESPGIRSIDSLSRPPLPVENAPATKEADKAPGLEKFPFTLGFTAEQGKFRIALNALLKMDQLMIIRALTITNTNKEGPPVEASAADPSATPFGDLTDRAESKETSLNVLLGRERIQVALSIEMVDFHFPVNQAEPEPKPTGEGVQ